MSDKKLKIEIYESELHDLLLKAISNYAPWPLIYRALLPANRVVKDLKKYIDNKI